MTSQNVTVPLHLGFSGYVAGVVNAGFKQRAFFEVFLDGQEFASSTFEGQGSRVPMVDVLTGEESWAFGPLMFNTSAEMHVSIHYFDPDEHASQMVGPITVHNIDSKNNIEFWQSSVISEDSTDQDHDDCTLAVLEYKVSV